MRRVIQKDKYEEKYVEEKYNGINGKSRFLTWRRQIFHDFKIEFKITRACVGIYVCMHNALEWLINVGSHQRELRFQMSHFVSLVFFDEKISRELNRIILFRKFSRSEKLFYGNIIRFGDFFSHKIQVFDVARSWIINAHTLLFVSLLIWQILCNFCI